LSLIFGVFVFTRGQYFYSIAESNLGVRLTDHIIAATLWQIKQNNIQ